MWGIDWTLRNIEKCLSLVSLPTPASFFSVNSRLWKRLVWDVVLLHGILMWFQCQDVAVLEMEGAVTPSWKDLDSAVTINTTVMYASLKTPVGDQAKNGYSTVMEFHFKSKCLDTVGTIGTDLKIKILNHVEKLRYFGHMTHIVREMEVWPLLREHMHRESHWRYMVERSFRSSNLDRWRKATVKRWNVWCNFAADRVGWRALCRDNDQRCSVAPTDIADDDNWT